MKLNLLEKSILATIAYYDIFDYPLTGFEVFKYLINPLHVIAQLGLKGGAKLEPIGKISFLNILETIKNKNLKNFIEEKNGFYCLRKAPLRIDKLVRQRIARQKIAIPRWKKVYKIIRLIQICPFIKMVAVCNSLAINNSKEEADIDFFIIVKKKRIWLTRFLVTFLIWLKGEWRHKDKIASKICLSFYITEEALNLEPVAIKPYDIYLAHWLLEIRPVYSRGPVYKEFILKNQWPKNYLLNFGKILNDYYPEFKMNKFLSFVQRLLEKVLKGWLGNLVEKILRAIQKHRISHKLTDHKIPTAVIVSDKILKFHEIDRREFFQKEFVKRLDLLLKL